MGIFQEPPYKGHTLEIRTIRPYPYFIWRFHTYRPTQINTPASVHTCISQRRNGLQYGSLGYPRIEVFLDDGFVVNSLQEVHQLLGKLFYVTIVSLDRAREKIEIT